MSNLKNNNIPILFINKYDCCGCGACYSICPKMAISMKQDEEGFLYPWIDELKCVKCRKCLHVCPLKKTEEREKND